MKKELTKLFTILIVSMLGGAVLAQPTHTIDFEPAGTGATWNWVVVENADNPPLEFIANPVSGGINTSATVAKFTARQAGNPWSLFFTDDDGVFTFNASNAIVKIMVYKSVISPVHFKVEGLGPAIEIAGANTVVNQWEELTFDFSAGIGNTYNRLVIIPDFLARTQDNIIYIDNIKVPDGVVITLPAPTVAAPTPLAPPNGVISVFSDVYTNIVGTDLTPNWGQSTAVSFVTIQGDNTMKYSNLNYQGIVLGSSQNLTAAGMIYLHLDFWNSNSTDFGVFLISPGPVETRVSLVPPGAGQTWIRVAIPLSAFAPVNLADVIQFKFDGNGTIYLDNIYFSDGNIIPVELTSFTASLSGNNVRLFWETATEKNNSGFQIERKSKGDFEPLGFITGAGTVTQPVSYSFVDNSLKPDKYYYRLKQIDLDGSFVYSDVVEVDVTTPDIYLLSQNYPNPFNPSTTISFSVASNSYVTLKVYDILGKEIMTLINKEYQAGFHTYNFDATGLNSGVYFYMLEANGSNNANFFDAKKMVIVK